jgi:hypothetical protein
VWQRHREAVLLGGLILSLATAVAVEAMPQPAPDALPIPARHLTLPRLAASNDAPPPVAAWQATALARPLFALDRRPPLVESAPDGSLPRLSGTIRFASTALAIFALPDASKPADSHAQSLVLGVGAKVAGWTIEEVADERVLLAKNGEMRALQLTFSKAPPAAVPAQKLISTIKVLHGKRANVFWQP